MPCAGPVTTARAHRSGVIVAGYVWSLRVKRKKTRDPQVFYMFLYFSIFLYIVSIFLYIFVCFCIHFLYFCILVWSKLFLFFYTLNRWFMRNKLLLLLSGDCLNSFLEFPRHLLFHWLVVWFCLRLFFQYFFTFGLTIAFLRD